MKRGEGMKKGGRKGGRREKGEGGGRGEEGGRGGGVGRERERGGEGGREGRRVRKKHKPHKSLSAYQETHTGPNMVMTGSLLYQCLATPQPPY